MLRVVGPEYIWYSQFGKFKALNVKKLVSF